MATGKSRAKTTDAAEILRRRYFDGKPDMEALLEEERADADVARRVYRLRTAAGLTQAQLASKIGTTASVISRLEDADYEGHSLSMLRRVAAAVGKRVEVRFVTATSPAEGCPARPTEAKLAAAAPLARKSATKVTATKIGAARKPAASVKAGRLVAAKKRAKG